MNPSRFILALLIASIGFGHVQSARSVALPAHELVNADVGLVLDDQGRLTELTNRQTGHRYVSAGAHAPWRMYYRLRGPMTGALDLDIDPDAQKASVTRKGNTLIVSYRTLQANVPHEGRTRELAVGLTLRVALEGDRLIWTAQIENREKEPGLEITELWLPWISGIADLGLGRAADDESSTPMPG